MNGHNKRGRCQRWSNLPTQILRSIAKLLQHDIISLCHFRLVCKNWNHSTTIFALSPHGFKISPVFRAPILISTIHLVNSSWIISSLQCGKGRYRYSQIFSKSPFDSFPTDFDLNRFQSRQLSIGCCSDSPSITKVLVCSPNCLPCIDDCSLLTFGCGGILDWFPLNKNKDEHIRISYGNINKFDDVVEFRGMILALDHQGKLYRIDPYTLNITGVYLNGGVSVAGWRKRLVVAPLGTLCLVVRQSLYNDVKKPTKATKQLFEIYELSHNGKLRVWVKLKSFGNRVLFVTDDCSFFVGVDGFGQNLKDCMVYSKHAFPRYISGSMDNNDVGFFRFDGDGEDGSFRPISTFQNFPFIFDSVPSWACQSPMVTSLHSRSQRELRQEDESESNRGIDNDRVREFGSNNEVTPVTSDRCVPQGSLRGEHDESDTRVWPCVASASEGASRLNFRDLSVCAESVPILEKIWSKHGDVTEKIAICNGDIIARTLESLANAVQILEDNTGRSLNDEEAEYLSSTLGDLQLMRFRVDWLAPKIDDAIAHHKSKHLMSVLDSIKGVTRAKARISERRAKLEEEMAECDETEKELDSEIAKLRESISCLGQELDFDKPLGGLI